MQKYIKNGSIFRLRGDGKRIRMTIPKINIPHLIHGSSNEGIGRGEGKPGDVIEKGKQKGKGKGDKAGTAHSDGVYIDLEMEQIISFLQEELALPNLTSKPNNTFDETKIKYNDISKTGPSSLLHKRKTMLEALKRSSANGSILNKRTVPGYKVALPEITPINDDKRFRQWNEIKYPSSNAVVFFARDGSASMNKEKCDIVSDVSWWIDRWIKHFYKKSEHVYFWHDTSAEEVDENNFYHVRYGGGTMCSSVLDLMADQFENRYNPDKWNIYVFYFTDGENYSSDNDKFIKTIEDKFGKNVVNMFGITEILPWSHDQSMYPNLLKYTEDRIDSDKVNLKSSRVVRPEGNPNSGFWGSDSLSEEERDLAVKKVIIDLLGVKNQGVKA